MVTGYNTTDALADSLPTVIASARIVREYEGVMPQLVDRVTLGTGVGLSWTEVSISQLQATSVTENTTLNNPQQLADTPLSITPNIIGIHTFFTDRVAARLSKNAFAKTGTVAMNAITRKKDEDGIAVLDGATVSLPGAGNTLSSGHIAAAVARITSNATEPATGPIYAVLHGFQIKDLYDEMTAVLGTGEITSGETARVFREGFKGAVAGARIYEDGNIPIDANDDAKGGVFAKEAIVLVEGRALRTETRREPDIGGGGTSMWIYDEYAYGERSPGNWLVEIYSDASLPTS